MRTKAAFTLVELLVVITIISVLAALLLPSMATAIYQARLVSCGNNLRQVGYGVLQYANDYHGRYPFRPSGLSSPGNQPFLLTSRTYDDRPIIQSYVDICLFSCPLAPGLPQPNLFATKTVSMEMWCSYDLWYGYSFIFNNPTTAMTRTDKMPVYNGHQFNILASDCHRNGSLGGTRVFSHPDKDDALVSITWDTDQYLFSIWGAMVVDMSYGLVDRNFLRQDGSLFLLADLAMHPYEPRLVQVPYAPKQPGWYGYIPPVN